MNLFTNLRDNGNRVPFAIICNRLCIAAILIISLLGFNAQAQSSGDYRSVASGDWTDVGIWEQYEDSLDWFPAFSYPTADNGVITIQNGHAVVVNADSIIADQVVVHAGGLLSISEGKLSVTDGPGIDVHVFGAVLVSAAAGGTLSLNGVLITEAGATFDWLGGFIKGNGNIVIQADSDFNLGGASGNNHTIDGDIVVTNNGDWAWSGDGHLVLANGSAGIINNGVITISSNADLLTTNTVNPIFQNNATGVVRKSSGGVSSFDAAVEFITTGSVEVIGGTLALNHNNLSPVHGGTFNIGADGHLSGNTELHFTGSSISNDGIVSLAGVTFEGSNQTLSGNGIINVLKTFTGDGLTLGGNQTVTGQLTLDIGVIHTGEFVLTIADSALVVGANQGAYVNGKVERIVSQNIEVFFPIGDATAFAPIGMMPYVSVPGGIVASTSAGDHPQIANSGIQSGKTVNRTWHIESSGADVTNYDLTFNWNTPEVDLGANTENFVVAKYDDG
ncbi:MAG TPA: hypothetical protein VEY71_02755, partial [Chitinophagales bacterium]|nr:hypothetical protein [Chitinophagales bacterium]